MWEGWSKKAGNNYRVYSLMIASGIQFLLEAHIVKLTNIEETSWKVSLLAFHPLPGEEVIYEELFPSFSKAEAVAWKQASEEAKDAYDNP